MNICFKILLLVLVFSSQYSSQLRDIQFDHFAAEEGLSNNTVLALMQDSRGFLWIGTFNGLNKYDGYNFKIYKNSLEDSTSISDNKIRALCEDKNGDIWIGTWGGGLNKFIRNTEKFKHFRHNTNNPESISSDGIFSICFDKSGDLWIGTENGGLDHFDPVKESFIHYKHNPDDPNSISDNSIYTVYIDKTGTLWCGTANNGLNKFDSKRKQFITFKPSENDPESISGNMVVTICENHFGNLWIGTRDAGLNKFNPSTNKFTRYNNEPGNPNSLSDTGVWVIYEDRDSLLWIGNFSKGLNLFDQKNQRFTSYRKNYSDPNSLSDDGIFSIYEDRTGVMWIGTWSGGLNKYGYEPGKFFTYSHDPNDNNSLSTNSVYAVYKDRFGILWVGTEAGGLNRIDERNNRITHYQHNPNDPFSLSSDFVYSICEDKEGYLWAATDNAGLNKFDRKTNRFQHYYQDPNNSNSISNNAISLIFCDSNGDLWIGTSGSGMDRLKKGKKEFDHFENDPDDPRSISPKMVYSFYEDRSKNLWIGTNGGGLMMYNRNSDDFTFYNCNPNDPANSLNSNIISSICEDDNGILWIGTSGSGLNKFDRIKKQFKHYREKDGLANDIIYGILKDDEGNLWISTGRGISRFNIINETFIRNYDTRDGLQDLDFNNWAYFKDSDGKMYFGGINGLNAFHPDEIIEKPYWSQISITDFQILHKSVPIGFDFLRNHIILDKSITETKLIKLSHDENILTFEITPLEFHNPEKNLFAYMMEGFDKNWIYTDVSDRRITYTNLDPGEYTLNVKGSNNEGVLNETGVSLKIIISPPWWATWWSYILYGFVFVLVFTGSTRFYLNRQRLRTQLSLEQEHAKKLEEVDKMKSNFYANISHEFRTPLMLILGPVEKLISKAKDEDGQKQAGLIKGNAKRLLTLINQLLDLSRLEAGKLKLNASKGNIAQFVKGLAMEFESIAERRDISLKVVMEKEDIEAYFDKEKLEKIITNVMSNAIKFTPEGGRITVKLTGISGNQVEIIVRDSGIGIPKSELTKIFDRFYQVDGSHTREHEGTGIGLALTKELVELHKGNIFVDSVEGHWTEVKLSFPLGREHLTDDEIIDQQDFKVHKIDVDEELIKKDSEAEDLLNENLIDKTIVLIVEDNPDVREYIKDALKETYHVEEAANGEQGLRKAEKFIPDLIVSDIMMPKMDGYEMTRRIKQNEKASHIPIILLTAKSDKDSKLQGLGLGADDYLIKPFDSDELLARIKNLIETRRMLQEKFGAGTAVLEKPEKAKLSCLDEQFMNRIMLVIDEHLAEEEFSIEEFGKDVGMSRSQIHRKLKALTGKSASVYLRTVRLAKAKQMIEQKKGTISEISYQVGFSSPAYFSRCFKDEFGHAPSEIK